MVCLVGEYLKATGSPFVKGANSYGVSSVIVILASKILTCQGFFSNRRPFCLTKNLEGIRYSTGSWVVPYDHYHKLRPH